MANKNAARTHDRDVERDFETGTVNPGPGMAPPHSADDVPAGSMTGAGAAPDARSSPDQADKDRAAGGPTGQKQGTGNATNRGDSSGCGCG